MGQHFILILKMLLEMVPQMRYCQYSYRNQLINIIVTSISILKMKSKLRNSEHRKVGIERKKTKTEGKQRSN